MYSSWRCRRSKDESANSLHKAQSREEAAQDRGGRLPQELANKAAAEETGRPACKKGVLEDQGLQPVVVPLIGGVV